MKEAYSHVGLERICRLFGISRQGYYSWLKSITASVIQDELILQLVLEQRKDHLSRPKIGLHNT